MTQNQVSFFKATEERRHNQAMEAKAREDVEIAKQQLALAEDSLKLEQQKAAEQARSNAAREAISHAQVQVQERGQELSYAANTLASWRSYQASLASTRASVYGIDLNDQNLDANRALDRYKFDQQIALEREKAAEVNRHNLASEGNQLRGVLLDYSSDMARVDIQQQQLEVQRDKLALEQRAQRAKEARDVVSSIRDIGGLVVDVSNSMRGWASIPVNERM